MAHNRQRQFAQRSKRSTDWQIATFPVGETAVAASTKVLLILVPSTTLGTIAPATIVRTRGIFAIRSDAPGVTELQVGAFGIGLVNDVAGALGVTALPGPSTDALWGGWFVHQFITQANQVNTAIGADARGVYQYEIDSKAMRKFESDEALVIMVENTSGSFAFTITAGIRFLVKAG